MTIGIFISDDIKNVICDGLVSFQIFENVGISIGKDVMEVSMKKNFAS